MQEEEITTIIERLLFIVIMNLYLENLRLHFENYYS